MNAIASKLSALKDAAKRLYASPWSWPWRSAARTSIRETPALGPGSIVTLNRLAGEPVDLLVNGKPIAPPIAADA